MTPGRDRAALTEKERQTLRLIVRGHDAKSIARYLDLSVHTVNERLRAARRKLAVSSSREAARLLLEQEGDLSHDSPVPKEIGDAAGPADVQMPVEPRGDGRFRRVAAVAMGAFAMILVASLVLLTAVPQLAPSDAPVADPAASPATSPATSVEAVAARHWLELVDQGRWEDSWKATGSSFQRLNTVRVWADTSKKVRVPLGAVVSRTLLSQESLPAPPSGYEVVKFRTSFANKADAVETVTLDREGSAWRVVGVYIG